MLNIARLESALGLPPQPYYHGVFEKAGALLRSMVKGHAYVDGNKRIGIATTYLFLTMNGRTLHATNAELVAFTLRLAASDPALSHYTVGWWLRKNSYRLGDRDALKRYSNAQIERLNVALDAYAQAIDDDEGES